MFQVAPAVAGGKAFGERLGYPAPQIHLAILKLLKPKLLRCILPFVFHAAGKNNYHAGEEIGIGQTVYKDLGITLSVARDSGVPMFTTSRAYQLFQFGISLSSHEDNWTIIKILKEIADTEAEATVPSDQEEKVVPSIDAIPA